MARYIEIDSTYRDRNLWEKPAQFEIPISQTGRKQASYSIDPVSNSSSKTRWISNNFELSTLGSSSVTVSVDLSSGVGSSSDNVSFIVDTSDIQPIDDYYTKAVIVDAAGDRRRIIDYEYLGLKRAQITIEAPFPTTMVDNDNLTIEDPTDITAVDPVIFVPVGKTGFNSYGGCVLYNETVNEYRRIIDYDEVTHLLKIFTDPVSTWSNTDTFSIREEIPLLCQSLTNPSNSFTTFNLLTTNNFNNLEGGFIEKVDILTAGERSGAFPGANTTTSVGLAVTSVAVDDFYNGCTINITSGVADGQRTSIVDYAGFIAILDPPLTVAPALGDTYVIQYNNETRRIVKYVDYRDFATGGSLTTIIFPTLTSSPINGFYNNLFIDAGASGTRLITNYSNRVATVNPAFAIAPVAGQAFTITSGTVSPNFSGSLSSSNDVCVLPFSYDNFNPFSYNGSLVSQQQEICYEIELLNLVLPNVTLNIGNRISFYPFVYVELANISGSSAGIKNILYSNNPNSSNILFRAAIDDVPNPDLSSFIKIDGDGMVQTVKFKPNDNLKFSVKLPDGNIFDTILPEHFSPSKPNPLIQISALFSIKRL